MISALTDQRPLGRSSTIANPSTSSTSTARAPAGVRPATSSHDPTAIEPRNVGPSTEISPRRNNASGPVSTTGRTTRLTAAG